jgi:hypothetical protein
VAAHGELGEQQLAAVRHLFDWLVVDEVVPINPAASVRGPRHVVRVGKTAVLEPAEARTLLDSIDADKPAGLRDRAPISLMVYIYRVHLFAKTPGLSPSHRRWRVWSISAQRRGARPFEVISPIRTRAISKVDRINFDQDEQFLSTTTSSNRRDRRTRRTGHLLQ